MKEIINLTVFILIASISQLIAQEYQVEGIVFDKDNGQRINRVYIYNTRSHKGFFNNTRGEFTTKAKQGDLLIAALENYAVDTVSIQGQNTVIFQLKRTSISLPEVIVRDTIYSPQKKLKDNQQTYRDIYLKGNSKELLSVGGNNGVGAGLSIDALYSLLSREGKNARYLQKIIERDYRESIIDYRFTPGKVSATTGLSGDALQDFMTQYRPDYYFILDANDYSLLKYIKSSYEQYKANPAAHRLSPLISSP